MQDADGDEPSLTRVEPRRGLLPLSISTRRGGIAVACALAAVGLVFAWQAAQLDLGGIGLPGPGFFPLLMGASLIALATMIAIHLLRDRADDGAVEFGHRDVLIVFGASIAVPLLIEPLGAYATLGLFGAVLLMLIARVSVVISVIAAAIAMVACWFFFQVLLGLQLPDGPW
jgi:putative tricarboxylic transport membrane protein